MSIRKYVGVLIISLMCLQAVIAATPDGSKLTAKVGDSMTYTYTSYVFDGKATSTTIKAGDGSNITVSQGSKFTAKITDITSNATTALQLTYGQHSITTSSSATQIGSMVITPDWANWPSYLEGDYNVTNTTTSFTAISNITHTYTNAYLNFPKGTKANNIEIYSYSLSSGFLISSELKNTYIFPNGTTYIQSDVALAQSTIGSLPGFELPLVIFTIFMLAVPVSRHRQKK